MYKFNPITGKLDYYETGSSSGVPYVGATQNVDLGEYQIKAGQLELDQTPTQTNNIGVISWRFNC